MLTRRAPPLLFYPPEFSFQPVALRGRQDFFSLVPFQLDGTAGAVGKAVPSRISGSRILGQDSWNGTGG